MEIFGYTKETEVKEINLPVDRIVAEGIDPWRLDVLDPDPVYLDDLQLNFSKLREVGFAYRLPDGEAVIGLYDGSQRFCVRGRLSVDPAKDVKLVSVRGRFRNASQDQTWLAVQPIVPAKESFEAHFTQYLRYYVMMDSIEGAREFLCPPTLRRAWRLKGNSLSTPVSDEDNISRFAFCGRMFELIQVPTKLPEYINWVFEELADLQPIVVGSALIAALQGEDVTSGAVIVLGKGETDALRYRFPSAVSGGEFRRDSYRYGLRATAEAGTTPVEIFQRYNLVSLDCMSCVRRNELTGRRIAFSDYSHGTARAFMLKREHDFFDVDPIDRLKRLKELGFNSQPFPLAS
jgi:hypothetical protein